MTLESTPLATPSAEQGPVLGAGQQQRSLRIRTFIAVVAVLGLGMVAAAWQMQTGGHSRPGILLSGWFGEGLASGMVLYAILHFSRKAPPGAAAVVAALAIVGTMNYQAYAVSSRDREAKASMAKALPLFTKIQSRVVVSDQEVRDANVGLLEPLLLAQAMNAREMVAVDTDYLHNTAGLQLEQMLTPASLVSPGGRAQTRGKLKGWLQATDGYKAHFDTAAAAGRQRIEAAQAQMPASMGGAPTRGYDQSATQARAHVEDQIATVKRITEEISAILDLLDANAGGYALYKGPPEQLEFRTPATLARYNALMGSIQASGQRLSRADEQQIQAQSAKVDKMKELVNR